MKSGIHPDNYRLTVIEDTSNGFKFLTKSTAKTDETTKWEDGNEYPLLKVHISSASHPFYTGEEKIMDVEGRVDRFKARAEAAAKKREAMANKAKKQAKRSEEKAEDDTTQKIGAQPAPTQKPTAPTDGKKSDKPEEKPTESKAEEAPADTDTPSESED